VFVCNIYIIYHMHITLCTLTDMMLLSVSSVSSFCLLSPLFLFLFAPLLSLSSYFPPFPGFLFLRESQAQRDADGDGMINELEMTAYKGAFIPGAPGYHTCLNIVKSPLLFFELLKMCDTIHPRRPKESITHSQTFSTVLFFFGIS
jgi:hypothetical protein